ncbi:MAG TPA: MFS transporter [Burkholderiales bacterium]|nr:MFS transporter [Burkholderiales bacterium]
MGDNLRPESRYAWLLVIVASLLMGMGAGALISIATFLKPLSADFGWLRGETSFAYMAGAFAMGVGGIGMGYLSDRYATRPVVVAGVIILGGSLLLLSTQSSLWQFYLYYCVLGGLGSAALDAPLLANVGNWFDRNKGLALGLALAGRALGQGGVPFLAGMLIASVGWRNAYAVLGVMCLVGMLPLTLFIRNPPGLKAAKEASRRASAAENEEAYPVPPKILVAWLSTAALFCCTCMGTAMVHAVAIAEDAGIGAQQAAGVILLIYVSGFFGRIAFGKLADHIGGIRSYWVASLGQTVLIYWFTQMHSLTAFYAHAVVFGFFMSGVMTGLIVCVRELTPVHVRGTSTGVVFLVAWIGMGLGGYQAGHLFDLSGSYTVSYAAAAAAGAVNLVILGALYFFVRHRTALIRRAIAAA